MNQPVDPVNDVHSDPPPANWREAVADLLSTRLELIELEAKEVAKEAATKGLLIGVIAGAAFFAWALILAGAIPLLAIALKVSVGWIALGAAGLHLIAALIAVARLKRPAPPAFSITRSEFKRDREWFKKLQPPPQ